MAAAGTFLVLLAFTVPLASVSATAADLGAGSGALAWVLSAMSVVLARRLHGTRAASGGIPTARTVNNPI